MNPADIQTYIQEQPAVLQRVLEEVPRAVGKMPGFLNADRIHLVGSGTSRHALLAARPLLAKTAHGPVQVSGPLSFMERGEGIGKGIICGDYPFANRHQHDHRSGR